MTTLLEDTLFELPDGNGKSITMDAKSVKDRLKEIVEDEDLRRYIL
jgi:ATP-dependent protease HslVU (ClpYQ) ATPase subunit